MATVSPAGQKSGATFNWARSSTSPANASAPSTNTGRRCRPTTTPRVPATKPADTSRSLTSGKRAERPGVSLQSSVVGDKSSRVLALPASDFIFQLSLTLHFYLFQAGPEKIPALPETQAAQLSG